MLIVNNFDHFDRLLCESNDQIFWWNLGISIFLGNLIDKMAGSNEGKVMN